MRASLGKHSRHPKNHNYVVDEDRLKLTYLFIYLFEFVPAKVYGDFGVLDLFCCL
jgi:hypothetical protein